MSWQLFGTIASTVDFSFLIISEIGMTITTFWQSSLSRLLPDPNIFYKWVWKGAFRILRFSAKDCLGRLASEVPDFQVSTCKYFLYQCRMNISGLEWLFWLDTLPFLGILAQEFVSLFEHLLCKNYYTKFKRLCLRCPTSASSSTYSCLACCGLQKTGCFSPELFGPSEFPSQSCLRTSLTLSE